MKKNSTLWKKLPCVLSRPRGMRKQWTLFYRIMRLTTVILFACLQVSATDGRSQSVTLQFKDASIEQVFTAIAEQTEYRFVYVHDDLKNARKVSISVKDANVEQILPIIFKDQPIGYEVNRNYVVVKLNETRITRTVIQKLASPQQIKDIHGIVTDQNGTPLQGVSVVVKSTGKGTSTNLKGEFRLEEIDGNATLVITSIGYNKQEIQVNNGISVSIKLEVAVNNLDELQIIAYGKTSRRFSTGNVSTIKGSEIEKQPVSNPILALQGRVPGLTVVQSTGISGGAVEIRIQGRNNLNPFFTGSDPLIVVDGVPYPSQNLLTFRTGTGTSNVLGPRTGEFGAAGSTLALINPDDIESIDILKDADATAIYGSRAANGAILITTKKGKAGDTKVDFNFQTGWGKVGQKWDMLNKEQYLQMRNEAKQNDGASILATDYDLNGLWDTTRYTDWQKELLGGTANNTRATLAASGGNTYTKYYVGATYGRETTVFPGHFSNTKGSVHVNVSTTTPTRRLQIQFTGSYLADNNTIPGLDYTRFIGLAPVAPSLHSPDGTLNWSQNPNGTSSWDNPLANNYNLFENKTNNLIGNLVTSYSILPGLEAKVSLGYTQLQSNQFLGSLDESFKPERRSTLNRVANFTFNTIKSWIIEPQANYSKNIGQSGNISILIGLAFQETMKDGVGIDAVGYSSDQLLRNLSAATSSSSNTINSKYRYSSIFARINYTLKNRYVLNLSTRRDGSSRFGKNNMLHNFGAVSAGWIFNEEEFMKKNITVLSYGKLRGSYGLMGNDQIGDYKFMSLFSSTTNSIAYQSIRGLESTAISNPNLQWEETRKLQAGIDLGFYKDRFLISVNYFRNRSNNTLTNVSLPSITGTNAFLDNFPALIQNTGWEFTLRTENIKNKSFTWSTSFNLTIPRNKLVSFPDLEKSTSSDVLIIGRSLGVTKAYSFHSIDPNTGSFLFTDASGDITSTPSFQFDRISILDNTEKYYGGLLNSISFKGLDLDFLFQFSKANGFNFLNIGGVPGLFNIASFSLGNQPTTVLDRWRKPGDEASAPRYRSTFAIINSGDWSFRDASFIRLKNISIAYRVPKKICGILKLNDVKLFANGQNILTITRYKGLDPETKSINTLPPLRVVTIGIRGTF